MADEEYDAFRPSLERFLEFAAPLSLGMQDRVRHDDAAARLQSVDTYADAVDGHFLDLLADAREELKPEPEPTSWRKQ